MARFKVYITQGSRKYTLWGVVEESDAAHAREIGAFTYNIGKPRWRRIDALDVRADRVEDGSA